MLSSAVAKTWLPAPGTFIKHLWSYQEPLLLPPPAARPQAGPLLSSTLFLCSKFQLCPWLLDTHIHLPPSPEYIYSCLYQLPRPGVKQTGKGEPFNLSFSPHFSPLVSELSTLERPADVCDQLKTLQNQPANSQFMDPLPL